MLFLYFPLNRETLYLNSFIHIFPYLCKSFLRLGFTKWWYFQFPLNVRIQIKGSVMHWKSQRKFLNIGFGSARLCSSGESTLYFIAPVLSLSIQDIQCMHKPLIYFFDTQDAKPKETAGDAPCYHCSSLSAEIFKCNASFLLLVLSSFFSSSCVHHQIEVLLWCWRLRRSH